MAFLIYTTAGVFIADIEGNFFLHFIDRVILNLIN